MIDSDYRGECIVALHNDTDEVMTVGANERIAQIVLLPYIEMNFKETTELSETERNDGGFGNSGRF